ncbi:MAG: helix-turn-helix transcriptional regulator, partial [Bauldia sp.]
MLSHARIWAAIDRLAERNELTPSGLARRAGLDSTTFNKSKRTAADGRPRWPSTESIAKILEATRSEIGAFLGFEETARTPAGRFRDVPVLGFAQAGAGGFFDDGGFPAGQGWDQIPFPGGAAENVFALEVTGDSMLPLYRNGDTIIVAR